MPKFASNTQKIQVGNGQYVGVLFVIPVILEISHHRVEIFMLVSEIFENVDLVLGIKDVFELEGIIDSHKFCFSFLSRSIPIFPREQVIVKPRERKLILIKAPFIEDTSGMAIVKIIDKEEKLVMMLKLKFIRNNATLDVTNNTQETVIFDTETVIGILDIRLLGYYKIKQGVLHQNLSKYYHFEEAEKVCEEFNKIIDVLKTGEAKTEEKYP